MTINKSRGKYYFTLFANCVPVKGASRSIICDLQKGGYYYIPNDLYHLLLGIKGKRVEEIYSLYDSSEWPILDEYFDFLHEKKLGFFDLEEDNFPSLNMEWDFPATISNAILDLDETTFKAIDYKKFFDELCILGCRCLQIRAFKNISKETLESILNFTINSRLREVRLVLKFENELIEYLKTTLLYKHKRIEQVIVFGNDKAFSDTILGIPFIFLNRSLDESECGNICRNSFSVNLHHFTEALNFNTCLNRKISLDSLGNVKNCPSQQNGFGHISEVSLHEVILNEQFTQLWKLKKDDIEICRDCEYRYICTDCRIFIRNKQDKNSKPSKCTYDPYTATWN